MAAVDHAGAKATLASVIHLHSLNLVRKNVAWYLINECISPEAAAALDDQNDAAVKAFVPHMNTALESLGLPDIEQLHSPIVRDFQEGLEPRSFCARQVGPRPIYRWTFPWP